MNVRIGMLLALTLAVNLSLAAEVAMDRLTGFVDSVVYSGNAGLQFTLGGKIITIDPVGAHFKGPTDVVLVTHDHSDHFSGTVIRRIYQDSTWLLGPASVTGTFQTAHHENLKVALPGETFALRDLKITPVPAYNFADEKGFTRPHDKAYGWVGYVLEGDGMVVYVTGDTQRIPEMKTIHADVIFLPLGQTYTMPSVEDAVAAARDVGARVAVPIHWGLYEGSLADFQKFQTLAQPQILVILKKRL